MLGVECSRSLLQALLVWLLILLVDLLNAGTTLGKLELYCIEALEVYDQLIVKGFVFKERNCTYSKD